jgi:hypothetical protein
MKTNSLLLLFSIATSLPAFAAHPPAAMKNEVQIVNDTREPLICSIGPASAALLPTVQSQTATLRFPRPHARMESRLEPGRALTIVNVQENDLILVGGQLLRLDHSQLQDNRCKFTVSRSLWTLQSLSISEPTCESLGTSDLDISAFE